MITDSALPEFNHTASIPGRTKISITTMKTCKEIYPINCEISAGGYFVCANVSSLSFRVRTPYENGEDHNLPLQTLDILATDFVVEYVSHLICGNLFSRRTLVDTEKTSSITYSAFRTRRLRTQPSSHQ